MEKKNFHKLHKLNYVKIQNIIKLWLQDLTFAINTMNTFRLLILHTLSEILSRFFN